MIKPCFAFLALCCIAAGCSRPASEVVTSTDAHLFPSELVDFVAYEKNPVFKGTAENTWDRFIRERGYIIKEKDGYHMWYTGYTDVGPDKNLYLGYATSPDGMAWTRYPGNPVFRDNWTEDVMVVKSDSTYFMFAEGLNDRAHMLSSTDKIHWRDHGLLDIRYTNGEKLSEGPYGTPSVLVRNNVWYLFYERNDEGIWLATSTDRKKWTNIQDEPVLSPGPENYDKFGVAVNQVIAHNGSYYAYYHGTALKDWSEWSTNIAVSIDLVHWKKYSLNPIMKENKSSGILVHDGGQYNLFTMHPEVNVHLPRN
jgi:beta-1,2-mannobiose phosphorylase / 1,2-beta-oligomannan phosphorylase